MREIVWSSSPAKRASERGWQQTDLPDAYRTLIGHEQAAESIFEYGGNIVPGLLQTAEYARAVVTNSYVPSPPDAVERAVAVRMRQQAILTGPGRPIFGSLSTKWHSPAVREIRK